MTREAKHHRFLDATEGDIRAELERIGLGDWGVRVGGDWAEVSSPNDVAELDDVNRIIEYFAPAWHSLEAVHSPDDGDEISVAVNLFWSEK